MCLDVLYNFCLRTSHSKNWAKEMIKIVYCFWCKVPVTPFNQNLNTLAQVFEKCSNTKFHENLSSGSRVLPYGQTGMTKLSRFSHISESPKHTITQQKTSRRRVSSNPNLKERILHKHGHWNKTVMAVTTDTETWVSNVQLQQWNKYCVFTADVLKLLSYPSWRT